MAKRISRHTLRNPKGAATDQRTTGAILGRLNEFTEVFAGADDDRANVLRADMTWGSPRDGEYIFPAALFHPINPANWDNPSGTTDYFESLASPVGIHIPLPLMVGDHVTKVRLSFYRNGANDPGITLLRALTNPTAGEEIPTLAWTTPSASTTWEVLEASYDATIVRGNWYLRVQVTNTGDRVRAAYVTVGPERS